MRHMLVVAAVALLAAMAATTTALFGLRCIAPVRFGFRGFRRLGLVAGTTMGAIVALAAWDIYQDVTAGRYGEAVRAGVGKPLDLKFTAMDGRSVDVSAMRGKVVLIEFWATWCGPCVAEQPALKALYEKRHSDGFEVIGISLDSDIEALRRFVTERALPWPQYFDGKMGRNAIATRFDIRGVPTSFLVDKQGRLRDLEAGEHREKKVAQLLAE